MDIRDVVKSIMETDVQAFVLYRSMTNYRSSVIITRRLNELIADEPDLQDVAVALAIYPALKWSMHGADADVVMSRMCKSDEELRRLGNVQKVLVAATGFEPRFLLENRKRYFDACSELIRLLEKAIKKVGEYPNVGKVYQSILKLFLMDSKEEPTKYIVNRYVKDAVRLVYTGRAKGCAQVAHIEAALGVTSPGKESALFLAESVLNGVMSNRRIKSMNYREEHKEQYCNPIFTSNGGSPERNGRPCMWRVVTLAPGMKTDFVLTAVEAEGVVNKLGGYSKKEGSPVTRIDVGMSIEELITFASAIKQAWQAYLVCSGVCVQGNSPRPTAEKSGSASEKGSSSSPNNAPEKSEKGNADIANQLFCVLYDTGFVLNKGFPLFTTHELAVPFVQSLIRELLHSEHKYVADEESYNAAVRFLEKAKEGTCAISFTSKINPSKECSLVIELAYPTVNFAGPQQGKTTA